MEATGRAETEGGASQGSRGGEEKTAARRGEGQRSLVKSTSSRLTSPWNYRCCFSVHL